jgi:hypothetical protein
LKGASNGGIQRGGSLGARRCDQFDEASTVFDDPLARIFDDEVHSFDEKREIIIGHSMNNRLLLVCFTERPKEIIHIISARLPTRKERKAYEENAGF